MNLKRYYIDIDDLFAEELSVENLLKYRGRKIRFIKGDKFIEKADLIQELAKSILDESRETKKNLLTGDVKGRISNGRFDQGNLNSKKIIADDEKVYLLYLLCGTMEKTGDALGVTRQTIAACIKRYR